KLELDTMDMLYRHQVEFAVGHGVSVHALPSQDAPDHAVLVKTEIIPRYEVPRTTPPTAANAATSPSFAKLTGLVLDMKELAETPAKQLQSMLEPLVVAYKTWIDAQTAKISDPAAGLSAYDQAPQEVLKNCRKALKRIEAGLQLLQESEQAA